VLYVHNHQWQHNTVENSSLNLLQASPITVHVTYSSFNIMLFPTGVPPPPPHDTFEQFSEHLHLYLLLLSCWWSALAADQQLGELSGDNHASEGRSNNRSQQNITVIWFCA